MDLRTNFEKWWMTTLHYTDASQVLCLKNYFNFSSSLKAVHRVDKTTLPNLAVFCQNREILQYHETAVFQALALKYFSFWIMRFRKIQNFQTGPSLSGKKCSSTYRLKSKLGHILDNKASGLFTKSLYVLLIAYSHISSITVQASLRTIVHHQHNGTSPLGHSILTTQST